MSGVRLDIAGEVVSIDTWEVHLHLCRDRGCSSASGSAVARVGDKSASFSAFKPAN